MAKVIITFSRDHTQVGKTVEIEDDQAAVMVNEGRARYADDQDGTRTGGRKTSGKTAEK
ncbi:hypothetical protein AB5J62_33545 [Amycolatopsis sp. cg5]|uniref:hypothetical protein n=1 Tax=Amycolatopsis sp. cg5 TaxID=3238802 RepID=UPI003524AA43